MLKKSLYEIFIGCDLELIMSKNQSKPKRNFKLSRSKQINLIQSTLRKYSEIIDGAVKLTIAEVKEQKNTKDRLSKSIIRRVLNDYLSLTESTYFSFADKINHEDWFEKQVNCILWLELFSYLQDKKIKCEYRSNFYKELFEYLNKLEDKNLLFLINKESLKKGKYHISKKIYKTDFINFFKLPRNIFENSKF